MSFHHRNPVRRLSAALAALVALAPPSAWAAGPGAHPHQHGRAELRIVVEGAQLEVALESPLDNLLGFERAPRTDKERAAVGAMADKLRRPQTLLTPTAAARCTLASVEITAPALPADLIGNPAPTATTEPAAKPPANSDDAHADLEATFRWRCDAPQLLKGLQVGLMQAFPGLRAVKVQVAAPRGQSAAVLSPGTNSVAW